MKNVLFSFLTLFVPWSTAIHAMHLYQGEIPSHKVYEGPVLFHCYWNGMLEEKHLISIRSCYETNVLGKKHRKIILWIENNVSGPWDKEIYKYAEVREFFLDKEVKGTRLEKKNFTYRKDLPFLADMVRMVLLCKHGGCWFDLDVFFFKDFSPLFAQFQEEVCLYTWEDQNYPNNAIFFSLIPGNKKLEDAVDFILARDQGWGFQEANLTFDLPLDFTVLPCAWFDPQWAPKNVHRLASFDAFFEATEKFYTLSSFYPTAFCYHWHNRWSNKIEETSPIRQLFQEVCNLGIEKK